MAEFRPYGLSPSSDPPSPPFAFASAHTFESAIDKVASHFPEPTSPSSNTSSDGQDVDSGDSNCEEDLPFSKKIPKPSRIQRNIAEKQRRDKLNNCIGKLASMVPLVSMSSKKINKTGVLRLTASYLRLHYGLLKGLKKKKTWLPMFLTNEELGRMLLESINGFMIIINEAAKVVFVSEGIEKILGHAVIDVLGQPIYPFIHPDDNCIFDTNVLNNLTSWNCQADELTSDVSLVNNISACNYNGIGFYCGMLEHSRDSKSVSQACYKLVHVVGHLKLISGSSLEGDDSCKQKRVGKFFIGIVKLPYTQPYNQLSSNTNLNEISFRSSLDGRFIFVDQRLSVVLGYMPSDVVGASGYEMMYADDIPMCAVAHTILLKEGCFTGFPVRLVTSTKKILYFITCGKLVRSVESGKLDTMFVVCTMISNDEGEKSLALAKHRFTPFVGSTDFTNLCDQLFTKDKCTSSGEPIGKELQFQPGRNAIGPAPKRPRGRPRKYPLVNEGAVTASIKKTSSTSDGSTIQQSIENFARTYASNLNIEIPATNYITVERDLGSSDQVQDPLVSNSHSPVTASPVEYYDFYDENQALRNSEMTQNSDCGILPQENS